MKVRPARIGHIGIVVEDLDRAIDFYTDVVGLRLTERFDYGEDEVGHGVAVQGGAFVRADSTHHCISIFTFRDSNKTVPPAEGGRPPYGLHHIAFELPTHDTLLEMYRHLQENDVTIVNARQGGPGNQPRFYALDPDGHLLEFYWGIDQIGWDGRAREYGPIEEIDLEDFNFDDFAEARDRMASKAE